MGVLDFFYRISFDYTFMMVALGAMIVGVVAGTLGAFALLRQQSLLGDAISHAALPGVGIAFLLTHSKDPLVLLLGAGLSGCLGTLFVMLITRMTRLKKDAALGIVLSVFFGVGLVLLTVIQKMPLANQSGLSKFLFGNASTLLKEDVITMTVLGMTALLIMILFWKEFKIITFDSGFAKSLGLRIYRWDILLTTLMVIAIVIGLQSVGVVLMSSLLVAPAAAARQWTNRLSTMVVLAAFFGAVSGLLGTLTSSAVSNLPTGPTIVLWVSLIVVLSLLFAPLRGLVWDAFRNFKHRREIAVTTFLKDLLLFSEIPTDPFHPHDLKALQAIGRGGINKTLNELVSRGWVVQVDEKRFALTQEGLTQAKLFSDSQDQ